MMKKAFFFDMDGVLFDSMPNHAIAWEKIMTKRGLNFTARDCYINEGRTGQDVIHECFVRERHQEPTAEEISEIYAEKCKEFAQMGDAKPVEGIMEVLTFLKSKGADIWIVTGSGQKTLFDKLDRAFNHIFVREKMITAFDVTNGKPNPEPYLKAWERSGFHKEDCCVIENAPLGIIAGKGAGLFTIGVNTGILTTDDLKNAGADVVLNNMQELLLWLKNEK